MNSKFRRKRPQRPPRMAAPSVPNRANRILNIILVVMLLILLRVWHVAVIQHDERVDQAQRPQRRARVERAERGTIRDRFGLPLAVNKIQYNAAVSYAQIREVPRTAWRNKQRYYPRRDHIERLAALLAEELDLDVGRVEDLIHSKAALFPNVPYVIKSNISEKQYYRLRMLEKDLLGLHAEFVPRRSYPQGKVAAEVLGYIGPISREEYDRVASELQQLRTYVTACEAGEPSLPPKGLKTLDDARARLTELEERAYSIHDELGKSGVEAVCEEQLRGRCGKRIYQQDIYGTYVRELPGGREPTPGQRVTLSLSAELQAFAEQLLAENEEIREGRSHYFDRKRGIYVPLKQPWMKGGAIVVIEPKTGEVLALASYPRFDPNSFIKTGDPTLERQRQDEILRWFETEAYLGQIWDGLRPLERERFDHLAGTYQEEQVDLTWRRFLKFALADESALHDALDRVRDIRGAVELQQAAEAALSRAPNLPPRQYINGLYPTFPNEVMSSEPVPTDVPPLGEERYILDRYFSPLKLNYDKILLVDLCRLSVDPERFTSELLQAIGHQALADYREANRAHQIITRVVQDAARPLFHDAVFGPWREVHSKGFLRQKRRQERERGTYQRPYLDYLDQQEREMFSTFWEESQQTLLMLFLTGRCLLPEHSTYDLSPFVDHFGKYSEEIQAGAHHSELWYPEHQTLRDTLSRLQPRLARDYLRSMRSFDDLSRPLLGKYRYLRGKMGHQTERDLAAAFYSRYGYGHARSYAFRQAAPQGSVFKVVTSYAALIAHYDKLISEEKSLAHLNPLTIIDDAHKDPKKRSKWNIGFTESGRPIPQGYKGGNLLKTHRRHVGKIDLPAALEVTSNSYFGLLAVDIIDEPEDLLGAASALSYGAKTGIALTGEYSGNLPHDLSFNRTGLYNFVCGQHTLACTPLQTATMLAALANGGTLYQPQIFSDQPAQIQRHVRLPEEVRNLLFKGMQQVVRGDRGGARPSRVRAYQTQPWMKSDYRDLHLQIIGKTGTAEAIENVDLDPYHGTNTYNHIWFGAISFEPDQIAKGEFGEPELAIAVYLRYGDYGRACAPLAAQMVKKWREIKGVEGKTSHTLNR